MGLDAGHWDHARPFAPNSMNHWAEAPTGTWKTLIRTRRSKVRKEGVPSSRRQVKSEAGQAPVPLRVLPKEEHPWTATKISPWLHQHSIPANHDQLPDSSTPSLLLSCSLALSFPCPKSGLRTPPPSLFLPSPGDDSLNFGTEDPKFPLEINSLFPKYSP